jgi:hypothetical protein
MSLSSLVHTTTNVTETPMTIATAAPSPADPSPTTTSTSFKLDGFRCDNRFAGLRTVKPELTIIATKKPMKQSWVYIYPGEDHRFMATVFDRESDREWCASSLPHRHAQHFNPAEHCLPVPVVHEQDRAANHFLPAGRALELVNVRVGRPGINTLDAIGGLGGEDSAVEKLHGIGPEGVQIPSLSGSETGIRYYRRAALMVVDLVDLVGLVGRTGNRGRGRDCPART